MNTAAKDRVSYARNDTAAALRSLQSAAEWLDKVAQDCPTLADRVTGLSRQLWATADVVRDVESSIAGIHADLRAVS